MVKLEGYIFEDLTHKTDYIRKIVKFLGQEVSAEYLIATDKILISLPPEVTKPLEGETMEYITRRIDDYEFLSLYKKVY